MSWSPWINFCRLSNNSWLISRIFTIRIIFMFSGFQWSKRCEYSCFFLYYLLSLIQISCCWRYNSLSYTGETSIFQLLWLCMNLLAHIHLNLFSIYCIIVFIIKIRGRLTSFILWLYLIQRFIKRSPYFSRLFPVGNCWYSIWTCRDVETMINITSYLLFIIIYRSS